MLVDARDAPSLVKVVPRLIHNLKVLKELMSDPTPPLRVVRSKLLRSIGVSFMDASGGGRGSSTSSSDQGISIYMGKSTKKESSNFLELENLVETLETENTAGRLVNVEFFKCTDNIVSERAFYKGNSKSQKLFNLVVRLRKFQMSSHCKIHVLHVAGTGMIEQGTDGLLRGSPFEGFVGSRQDFLSYLPLDKSVFDRSDHIKEWLNEWTPPDLTYLTHDDWFEKGHDVHDWMKSAENKWAPVIKSGTSVWRPPPAAAYKALEQLRIARHKRTKSVHIFLCPRLFTSQWRSQLHKSVDLIFEVPRNTSFLGPSMHEPIVVGIYFPSFQYKPWFIKGTPWIEHITSELRKKFKDRECVSGLLKDTFEVSANLDSGRSKNVENFLLLKIRNLIRFTFSTLLGMART